MRENSLSGKTALVTGAGRRLGAAIARALAQSGTRVLLHYNQSDREANTLASEIQRTGGQVELFQMDLVDTTHLEDAIASLGEIDILVNNASIFDEVSFSEMTPAMIQANIAVNAIAPLMLARGFAAQGRPGVIINLLDTMIMDYDKRHVPYHISKRVFHTLTRMMALEFAPKIRVNAVAPGLILPPPGKDERYLQELAHTNPLNRYGHAQDVVDAVLYLINATFVTGQTLFVDGGRHLKGHVYE